MRSLQHVPGVLWWAPDSGEDLTQYLHGFFDAERIQRRVQACAEREERSCDRGRLGAKARQRDQDLSQSGFHRRQHAGDADPFDRPTREGAGRQRDGLTMPLSLRLTSKHR